MRGNRSSHEDICIFIVKYSADCIKAERLLLPSVPLPLAVAAVGSNVPRSLFFPLSTGPAFSPRHEGLSHLLPPHNEIQP